MNRVIKIGALALLVLLCLALTAVAVQAQGPTLTISQIDKSEFPEITVYVSVIDNGNKPVTGLSQQDFQVEEEGNQVAFRLAGGEQQSSPITIVLIIDRSGSMRDEGKLRAAKDAAQTFIELMSSDDRVALVVFNHHVKVAQRLTLDKSPVANRIDGISAGGDTAVYDAVVTAAQILQPIRGRKAAILLTDGMDNSSSHSRIDAIEKAGDSGFSLFTIGLGEAKTDKGTLEEMAMETGGYMFLAPSPGELTHLYELINQQIMSEYRLIYHSPQPAEDGTRRSVKVMFNSEGIAQEDQRDYVVAGVVPPSSLGTWTASSWMLFGSLLVLLGLLLIPQGVPALISRGRQRHVSLPPPVGASPQKSVKVVPAAQVACLAAILPLTRPDISLGSSASNDVVIRGASVANRQARIYQEAGRDVVEALGSSTGTFVSYSGEPGQEQKLTTRNALKEGSYIRLGKATPMVFHAEPRSLVVRYALMSGKVTMIGSDSSNDIVINIPSVSEKHAEIRWKAGAFVIKDLGSHQGTFIRYGGKLSPERRVRGTNAIQHGSIIRVGDTQFLVEIGNTWDTT